MYGSVTASGDGKGQYQQVPLSSKTRKSQTKSNHKNNEHASKTNKRIKDLEKKRPVFQKVFPNNDGGPKSSSKTTTKKKSKTSQHQKTETNKSASLLPGDKQASGEEQGGDSRRPPSHSFVFNMLHPESNEWQAVAFRRWITGIILVDLVFFILSTDEQFKIFSHKVYYIEEGVVSTIFLLEYVARVCTITEQKPYRNSRHPLMARLRYMMTWDAIIDLVAALPFFLELPTGWELPNLTYLRFSRIFRILKSAGAVKALDAVYRVVYFNRAILWVACLLCVLLVFGTSILLYYCRPDASHAQTAQFDSLSDTMYMSTLMLTGGGGPDTDTLPWYTRAVVLLTQVLSVPMFAIPASMLTWGFEAEAERMAKETRKRALERRRRQRENRSDFEDDDDGDYDGNTTDEEYFRLIAGEEAEEEEDDKDEEANDSETSWMKEQKQKFDLDDVDLDGALTVREFLKIQQSMQTEGPETSQSNTKSSSSPQQQQKQLKGLENKLDRVMTLLEKQQAESQSKELFG